MSYYPPNNDANQPVEPKKKAPTFKETWNSGASGKCGIIAATGILLLVVFACIGVVHIATGASSTTPVQASQNTPTVVQATKSTTKPPPTVKPTVVAPITATHGTPVFGGLYSDFLGKYGKPVIQGILH